MKTMTCRQLGGACDIEFRADSFEEMAELSHKHGVEMHQKGDAEHQQAMQEMQQLMQNPEDMGRWFEARRDEFDSLPDS